MAWGCWCSYIIKFIIYTSSLKPYVAPYAYLRVYNIYIDKYYLCIYILLIPYMLTQWTSRNPEVWIPIRGANSLGGTGKPDRYRFFLLCREAWQLANKSGPSPSNFYSVCRQTASIYIRQLLIRSCKTLERLSYWSLLAAILPWLD